MQFVIGKEVERPKDSFVVEVQTMYGDADGEGLIEVGPFKRNQDEPHLEDLIQTCKRMARAYPHGRGGGDDYNHVEGFNKWFACDWLEDDEYEALGEHVQGLLSNWENDPQSDGYQASYDGYEVYYYDEHGKKFKVHVQG